jgi:hypothetical protein
VLIGARGVARAMLTEMNGPELGMIKSDFDAELIYSHLIDFYNEALYGGWVYHKRPLRRKHADGSRTWPPFQVTKVVPSAVYQSASSGSSRVVSDISAERHLITTFHFPAKPRRDLVLPGPAPGPGLGPGPAPAQRRSLQVSVDRHEINAGASTSRGHHQPSPAHHQPSTTSEAASSSSRHNKRKCTTPTNTVQSKTQRILRRSTRNDSVTSKDKDEVIDVKSDSEEEEQDEVRKNNHSNKLIDEIS